MVSRPTLALSYILPKEGTFAFVFIVFNGCKYPDRICSLRNGSAWHGDWIRDDPGVFDQGDLFIERDFSQIGRMSGVPTRNVLGLFSILYFGKMPRIIQKVNQPLLPVLLQQMHSCVTRDEPDILINRIPHKDIQKHG